MHLQMCVVFGVSKDVVIFESGPIKERYGRVERGTKGRPSRPLTFNRSNQLTIDDRALYCFVLQAPPDTPSTVPPGGIVPFAAPPTSTGKIETCIAAVLGSPGP